MKNNLTINKHEATWLAEELRRMAADLDKMAASETDAKAIVGLLGNAKRIPNMRNMNTLEGVPCIRWELLLMGPKQKVTE